MANVHLSAIHGIPVDMEKLFMQNQKRISLGNMHINARGDELGSGGKIIKTREQVIQEWHEANPTLNEKAVVNIKANKAADEKVKTEVAKSVDAPAPAFVAPKTKKKATSKIEEVFDNIASVEEPKE